MNSIFEKSGLPDEFGLTLLLLGLALLVSPYLAGSDFGFIKIPQFDFKTTRRLRIIGPIAVAGAVAVHVPLSYNETKAAVDLPHPSSLTIDLTDTNEYDGCRVIRTSTQFEHHNNSCIERGYLGYDPAPERGSLGVGVCFARQECATQRPGIDPF